MKETASQETINEIMNMTLDELKGCKVDFGKAHLGEQYQEMVSETRYLTWFVEKFRHCQKPSHMKFLRLIQLHVDQAEQRLSHARPKPMAKAKVTGSFTIRGT